MDFIEKAKTRMEHWLRHNEQHVKEYEHFAQELDAAGQPECTEHLKDMIKWSTKANEALQEALQFLGPPTKERTPGKHDTGSGGHHHV